jgi:hypothetical protein
LDVKYIPPAKAKEVKISDFVPIYTKEEKEPEVVKSNITLPKEE